MTAPYDPDSYDNNYEIKCMPNQNCRSNVVCIAEDPVNVVSFTVRAFDLDGKGKPCFEKRIKLKEGSSCRLLGFYWPFLVYCVEREPRRYSAVSVFKIQVLNMLEGSIDETEIMDCGDTGSSGAPMAAFSNDGAELAVAYNVDSTCRVGLFDMTQSGFPLTQEYTFTPSSSPGMPFTKLAICRSKLAVILREDSNLLDYIDVYDRFSGRKLCRMLARAHGWHLSAPFRFLDSTRLLVAADDILIADFTPSSRSFTIGLLLADNTPSFTVQPASITADRLLSAISKHYEVFNTHKMGKVRSLTVYEDSSSKAILIYKVSENGLHDNSTATELSRWFAGAKAISKVELSPTSCPLNGVYMGADVAAEEKMDWKDVQEERARFASLFRFADGSNASCF
jgi:hypothetical protein